MLVALAVFDHAEFVAHAPLADQFAGDAGGLFDVTAGAAGHVAEDDVLRDASAHDDDEVIEEFFAAGVVFVLFGQPHGGAEGGSARDDGDFVERGGVLEEFEEQGVAGLVVGGDFFFFLADGHAAAFLAPADFVAGFLEFAGGDGFESFAGGEEGGLVDHVGQFGAGVAGGAAGDDGEVDAVGHFHFLDVDAEDFFAAAHIGEIDGDLAVEAARTEQGGVEDVGAVGRGDDDDAVLRVKAVHLDEERVECLLAFVVPAAHTVAAVAPDGVDFIDEDEAGRALAALLEHVTDARGADADEHLDEVGAADAEEGDIGFAGDGAGEEGFPGAG